MARVISSSGEESFLTSFPMETRNDDVRETKKDHFFREKRSTECVQMLLCLSANSFTLSNMHILYIYIKWQMIRKTRPTHRRCVRETPHVLGEGGSWQIPRGKVDFSGIWISLISFRKTLETPKRRCDYAFLLLISTRERAIRWNTRLLLWRVSQSEGMLLTIYMCILSSASNSENTLLHKRTRIS